MPADPPIPIGLPWYFTMALVVLWLSTVAGVVILGRRRIRLWRAERSRRARRTRVRTRLPANLRQ